MLELSETAEEGPSTATEMMSTYWSCWSEAENQTEGPQTPQADVYTQTDLPRIKRAAQILSSRQLQSLKVPQALKAELGVMGASLPSWINFSERWLCCERSSSDYVASRNLSGRLTNGMFWHTPSNSPALNPGKTKVNRLPALNKHIWKSHRTKKSGPLSLPGTWKWILAPKVPLNNRYDARERRLRE